MTNPTLSAAISSVVVGAVAIVLGSVRTVAAQSISFSRPTGVLELTADLSRQRTQTSIQLRRFDRDRFEQRLKLSTTGSILSPKILRLRLGGDVGFRQESYDSNVSTIGDAPGTILGYDLLADLFTPRRISFLFFANRHQDSRIQEFGTDTDVFSEVLGGTVRLRVPYFPLSFTARRSQLATESRSGLFFNRRDETRRLLEVVGSHNSKRTTARLRVRNEDVEDDSIPPLPDYNIKEATAALTHRWGSELDKYVRVNLRHFARSESFQFQSSTANSVLAWDVTDDLLTQAEYQYTRFNNLGQRTTTHRGIASASHQLYDSLSTRLRFLAEHTSVNTGDRLLYGPEGSLRYRKKLPWSSVLRLDGRVLYRIEDRHLDSPLVRVPAERLAITGPLDNFLAQRNVVTSSIRVFSETGSEFIEGVDYTVEVIGDRTSINPVLGGGVSIGQVVVVNYEFITVPDAKLERMTVHAGGGLDFGWLAVRFDHDQSNERVIEGNPIAGQDTVRDAFRIDLRRQRPGSLMSASVLLSHDETTIVEYDELALVQMLALQFLKSFSWNLDGRQSWRDFESPARTTRVAGMSTGLTWADRRGHRARLYFRFRDLVDTAALDQQDLEVGIRGRIKLGRIEVDPLLRWVQTQRGTTESRDLRFFVAVRRRF